MSLQVWLPLNGNFNNQGIGKITIDAGTPTFKTTGKIGEQGINLKTQVKFSCPALANLSTFTIAFWAKAESSSTLTGTWVDLFGFSSKNTSGSTGNFRWETCYSGSSLGIHWHNNSVNALTSGSANHISKKDTWVHCCVVFNKEKGKLYSYNNGSLYYSANHLGGTINASGQFYFGQTNQIEGIINDLRIYDHALSDKEVKEISKGLILHYKLDNIVNPNLLIDSNAPSLTKVNATHNRYLEGASSGSYTVTFEELTDPPEIGIKYGVRQKNTSGSSMHSVTWFSGALVSVSATPYTMSCYVKRISEQTNLKIKFQYGKSPYKSATQNIINDHEWHKYSWTFTPETASGQAAASGTTRIYPGGLSVSPGEVLICGWKLEEGTVATSWILNPAEPGYNDLFNMYNTIYDSSGYGNNGTIHGTLTTSTLSARYKYATYISSGNTNYITTPILNLPGDQITMNFWFKSSNTSPGSNYHMPLEATASSNQAYEMSINKDGYLRGGLVVAGSRKVDNCTSNPILLNGNWHMCSMTYDGTIIKRYINGVMEKSTSASGALVTSTDFVLGHYGSNTSYYCKEAYISDVRIYTTALSEADILELYNTSASIDSFGNTYARELAELNNVNITSQGQLNITGINENNNKASLRSNGNLYCNNFYEY